MKKNTATLLKIGAGLFLANKLGLLKKVGIGGVAPYSFSKYKQNLSHDGKGNVYSYSTKVATLKNGKLHELGKWSSTTSKHVNFAAREWGVPVVHAKW